MGLGKGENKWSSSWGLVLLLLILVFALLVSAWIRIGSGASVPPGGVLLLSGRASSVGRRRWRLSRRRQSSKGVSFYFPFVSFFGEELYFFSWSMVSYVLYTAGCAGSYLGAHPILP